VNYLSTVLLWILWCALHSTLITTDVTDYMKKWLGDRYRFYRLFYNIVAVVTLLPLAYYSLSIQGAPIFRWQGPLVIAKYVLQVTSLYLFIAGASHYRMSQFLGIHQIKTGQADHTLSEHDTFDTTGILDVMRHPWYVAGIMIVLARDISLSTLLSNIVICAYFVVGAILEERKLVLEFGEKYRDYQKNVSMFLPYKWLNSLYRNAS
jgi:methanethiol S-methyltransferase